MPIKFRQPQDINAIRFGATLVWGIINGVITTVTGASPLALVNALAKPIKKLIQYGKVTTSGGKTYCNNGEMVSVHRSGLPRGYTLLDCVGSGGEAYVLTDFHIASTDLIESEFCNSSSTNYGALYGIFRLGDSSAFYANQTYYGYDGENGKVNSNVRVDTDWHSARHDFVNGTLTVDDVTVTFEPFEFVNDVENGIFARYYNKSYGYFFKGYIRKFKVTRGNEVVCDLLPCKNEQNVAGLYDLASNTFYEPTGGALLEGNEVDDYELSVEGTAEVLTVGEQTASVENLLAVDNIKDEQDIISGVVTRRCEAVISDGTTPSGRYIGTVGEGNIIVKARETGYDGDIATFTADRAEPLNGLTVDVEPIQELNGYENPWPAGGSKNLIPDGTNTSNGYVNGQYLKNDGSLYSDTGWYTSEYFPVTAGETYTWSTNGNPNSPSICFYDSGKNYISSIQAAQELPKTFTAPSDAVYCRASQGKDFKTNGEQIELGSTATTPKPYSNICPISGRTSVNVTSSRKNMWGADTPYKTGAGLYSDGVGVKITPSTSAAVTVSKDGDDIVITTTADWKFATFVLNGLQPGNYSLSFQVDELQWTGYADGIDVAVITADYVITRKVIHNSSFASSYSTRINLTGAERGIAISLGGRTGTKGTLRVKNLQLELSSTATAYEPYQGNTYTIQLGETVYGGTLDVTQGKMVVDRAIVDLGTLTWQNREALGGFSAVVRPIPKDRFAAISSCYPYMGSYSSVTDKAFGYVYNNYVFVRDSAYSDTASLTTALNGQTMVYELATPIEITLSPTQIEMLLGENNLWADAGSVKAYVADAELIEHVTPQPMRTAEGNNTVAVTSAVGPVQLNIEYYKDE